MRALLPFLLSASAFAAGPCLIATPACTEFVTLGSGPARTMIYRTFPLTAKNQKITRALIVIHGTNRDADNFFRTALAAAFLANALDDTELIVPHIVSAADGCKDALAPNEVSWNCASWRTGGASVADDRLTTFDMLDDILRILARKDAFPDLKIVVVAGHSAGGQFVNRYEMSNRVHETLGVPVRYVVANPSSYAWIDSTRPDTVPQSCPNYNHWPYGLEDRSGYAARVSAEDLKKQLASRPTAYLLGEIDILPLAGFDRSCSAMRQGPTRLARGQNFGKYADEQLGAKHEIVVVPLCGHNARCMFTADDALPLLFPKQ
ncbi:MAG TPA: hypothetical protein VHW09_14765 [Bryobacteraceae bacterium]|jgi:hypothetical protein|nr:hypothetical protein [Bryobacteraceae bacterium]